MGDEPWLLYRPKIITPRDARHGSKFGDTMRRLVSTNDGEFVAVVCGMRRLLLESVGATQTSNSGSVPEPVANMKLKHSLEC